MKNKTTRNLLLLISIVLMTSLSYGQKRTIMIDMDKPIEQSTRANKPSLNNAHIAPLNSKMDLPTLELPANVQILKTIDALTATLN